VTGESCRHGGGRPDRHIFRSSVVDQIARNVLALVAVIYMPSVGVQLYGEIGRLDRAAARKQA
jgi:hypothetical protein